MEQPSNRLKMPEGVTLTGPVADLTEAYIKAVIAVPEILNYIAGELQGINDSLSMLALYIERKGLAENIISQDDLKGDEDDNEKAGQQPAN